MRTKPRQSLHRLMFIFTLLAFLTSCGDGDHQVGEDAQFVIIETAIPGVYFEIPEGTLPKGLDPADIKIEPTSPPEDIAKSTNAGDIQAWKLMPEGTRFDKPVRLVMPFEEALPSFLHIYNGEQSWVADVFYKITPQGHTASVSLEHFSELVVFMGDRWRQAFEFSAAVPDTQVGELVEAELTVSMSDYFTTETDEETIEAFEYATGVVLDPYTQIYVVPGSKKYCGSPSARQMQLRNINENTNPCSVNSTSNNLEPKDIVAFRDQANIQPSIQSFEEQFTLGFGGYRCTDVGPAVISFNFSVEWEGLEKTSGEAIEPSPLREIFSIRVDVPVNCVEGTAVVLLDVKQRVRASAYARKAANNEETWESSDKEFYWSAFDDGPGSFIEDYRHEGNEGQRRYPLGNESGDTPPKTDKYVPSESQVSVPIGLEALARLNTRFRSLGSVLTVDGDLYLYVKGMAAIDRRKWSVLGHSSARLIMEAAIRKPSIVEIENCVLFEQSKFEQFTDYQYSDASCSFKVEGAATLERSSNEQLPGISLPRVSGLLGGQVVKFRLDVDGSTEEPLEEKFSIRISSESAFNERERKNKIRGQITSDVIYGMRA